MAKNITKINNKEEFNSFIDTYGELKTKENELSKETKKLNESIKNYMSNKKLDNYKSIKYVVELKERIKETYNEFMLLRYLKENNYNDCIKIKEYVDTNKLEEYIYNDIIKEDELKKFKDINITKVLSIKAIEKNS